MAGNQKHKSKAMLWLLIFIVLAGLSVLIYQWTETDKPNSVIETQDEVPRVTASEAYKAINGGAAVLLDVRAEGYFKDNHAVGAINIPLAELESRLSDLDPETWYIPYCT